MYNLYMSKSTVKKQEVEVVKAKKVKEPFEPLQKKIMWTLGGLAIGLAILGIILIAVL